MQCYSSGENELSENTLVELIHSIHVHKPFWRHLVRRWCHRSISKPLVLGLLLELSAKLFAFRSEICTNQIHRLPYTLSQSSGWTFHLAHTVWMSVQLTSQVESAKQPAKWDYCPSANEKKVNKLDIVGIKEEIKCMLCPLNHSNANHEHWAT